MKGVNFTLSTETGIVCIMEVDKRKAKFTSEYEGQMHYFFSLLCKKELYENPAKYINFYGPRR